MREHGYEIDTVFACGGGTRNRVFLKEHADVTGCRIILPKEPETVLLGSAVLGAVASGAHRSILDAMSAMCRPGEKIHPEGGSVAAYHEAKHAVFHRMYEDQVAYADLMDGTG
jgi:ribulose kinase